MTHKDRPMTEGEAEIAHQLDEFVVDNDIKYTQSLQLQIDILATFIAQNYPQYIQGGGAIETAINILKDFLPKDNLVPHTPPQLTE